MDKNQLKKDHRPKMTEFLEHIRKRKHCELRLKKIFRNDIKKLGHKRKFFCLPYNPLNIKQEL